jgi:hypothetical protein
MLTLALFAVPALAAVPRIEVDPPREIDLGALDKGTSHDVKWELRNAGDATLEILKVEPACGCTVVTFDRQIPPGGAGKLSATLNTASLDGSVGKGIVLFTNDPERPKVMLVIRAIVQGSVLTLPDDRLMIRNYANGGVGRLLLRRDPTETGSLRPAVVRASAPWIDVRVEEIEQLRPPTDDFPTGRPGDWLIEARLGAGAPYGQHRESIELATGLGRQPRVEIPVLTDVHPPVSLPFDKLLLTAAAREETVILSVRKGLEPGALRAEAHPEGLVVELEPGGGRFYKARIRWNGTRPPEAGAAVTFSLGAERVELPVEFSTATR